MQCNTTHGNACTGAALICEEKETYKGSWDEDMELPIFDLITISNATHNFARYNKLGEGGFGSVYKAIVSSFFHHSAS
ncbi:g-type lectin s-receptor-like serine/threonine-protein kinase [Quercus suber]|uniref:G-type lectin s-receptor-like serine/threonine-protein kinase n=1 Tax=Quercus suber TaxID=58331 RepID=A0AAW0KMM7_QUESU